MRRPRRSGTPSRCRTPSRDSTAPARFRQRRRRRAPPGWHNRAIAVDVIAATPDASWTFAFVPLALVVALSVVYVRRWRAVGAPVGRLLSFLGGMTLVAVALCSPIDRLGEQLFFMHMIQHLILLDLATILVILGLTKRILRPLTRRLVRLEQVAGPLAHPVFAIVVYVAVMAVWHLPALYDAALEQPVLHTLEHMSFAFAGALYWWFLLSPIRARRRLGGMGPIVYMSATKVLVGLLGIMLAFAPEAIYDFYERQPGYWGLSPQTDQAVGGLVMALEQSIVMGIALVFLFIRALGESEREEQRAERYAGL